MEASTDNFNKDFNYTLRPYHALQNHSQGHEATGANAEGWLRPAAGDTLAAASSGLIAKIINTSCFQNCLELQFGSLVLPLSPSAEVTS